MWLEKSTFHTEKPKKTGKLEKQQKRVIIVDTQKIEPKKMQEINTWDHQISREIIAPKIEQKKTLNNRINNAKNKLETTKDKFTNRIKREAQFARITLQEAAYDLDRFEDLFRSFVKLWDMSNSDIPSEEIDAILKHADRTQIKWLMKRIIRFAWSKRWDKVIAIVQTKSGQDTEEDMDYGLDDRPVANKPDEEIYRGLDGQALNID